METGETTERAARTEALRERLTAHLRDLLAAGYTLGEIAWVLRRVARDWGEAAAGEVET